jgi:hypothetical protein
VPLRENYLRKMETLAARGARPIRYGPDTDEPEYIEVGWYEESPFRFVQAAGGG